MTRNLWFYLKEKEYLSSLCKYALLIPIFLPFLRVHVYTLDSLQKPLG